MGLSAPSMHHATIVQHCSIVPYSIIYIYIYIYIYVYISMHLIIHDGVDYILMILCEAHNAPIVMASYFFGVAAWLSKQGS